MLYTLRGNHARGYKLKSIKEKTKWNNDNKCQQRLKFHILFRHFFIERHKLRIYIHPIFPHKWKSLHFELFFFTYFFIISYTCYREKVKDHFLFLFASNLISFIIML